MRQQFQVDRLALLGRAEGEHLDLGELMDAVQAARVAARGAGLGAEAVRQADVLAAAARSSSRIWSRCMPPSVISAVAIRHRSVSAML